MTRASSQKLPQGCSELSFELSGTEDWQTASDMCDTRNSWLAWKLVFVFLGGSVRDLQGF